MTQVSNRVVNKKPSFSSVINSEGYQQSIKNALQTETKTKTFTTSIISAVQNNPALQVCTVQSIVTSALIGESLNLSPSSQLGHYYLVPYKNRNTGVSNAQFQLGYKGMIQLAIRSGQYKKINVLDIKEGELIKYDPLNEDIEVNLIEDVVERENAQTIGYYAMFELINGFRKALYWSREQMEKHALQYSQGYSSDKRNNTKYTFWSKDFDGMAFKTMLRQLISKWGIMSIELQTAYEKDMSVTTETGEVIYPDNSEEFEQLEENIPIESEVTIKETVQEEAPQEKSSLV